MIQNIHISNNTPKYKVLDINTKAIVRVAPYNITNKLSPANIGNTSFTGMSSASHYKSVFDYLAADILSKNKKFQVAGNMLSASNISKAITKLFETNRVFGTYTLSIPEKIKWKPYIPQDVRVFSIEKINEARTARLQQWQRFLEYPEGELSSKDFPELIKVINSNNSLKFVIWHAINSELKSSNRHIPVPLDPKALYKTIIGFEKIEPFDRSVRCAAPSFIDIYTHRLRDLVLEKKGLSEQKAVWVKIPSVKKDPEHKAENISDLEILSCRNWCTRSSVDKAVAALLDGDFYIYLERDKFKLWKPLIGMASYRGKIDQIQGVENNNVIPVKELEKVKTFLKEHNLKCHSNIVAEGPKALQQIYISEILSKTNEITGKTLEKACKEESSFSILTSLFKNFKITTNGKIEIETYRPFYNANENSGISIPFSIMGIDEDLILQDVEIITGDLVLTHKNPLYNSRIKRFPQILKRVYGKVIVNEKQYEMFKDDLLKVVNNQPSKIIIHKN